MQPLGVKTVSIAGSGNVGSFMAIELHSAGFIIKQIYSRRLEHAEDLALKVKARAVNDVTDIDPEIDLLVLALPDRVILDFVGELSFKNNTVILASTAGALDLRDIQKLHGKSGVIYPLQSFTRYRHPEPSIIPFCIEGVTPEITQSLVRVAESISNDVRTVDSQHRKVLHLAAVFACNFTNHILAISETILEKANLNSDILLPLVNETVGRLNDHRAIDMQTGPAVRNDWNTIEKHLELIGDDENTKKIYQLITDNIILLNKLKSNDEL
jgi:predicted short-subunit dehydrogenase-like oxidoreductase (DUF2520 family)